MVAEASGDKCIELPDGVLPVFLRLLREKTIPWKSRFWPSRDIMLELKGAEFRMRPNGDTNLWSTLVGTINRNGPVAVVRWRREGLEMLSLFTYLWLSLVVAISLELIVQTSEYNICFISFFFMALGLAVFFGFRYQITKNLEKMEQLLKSLAAEAAAEAGKAASVNSSISEK